MWKSMVNVFSSKTSSSLKCDPLKRERLQHITPMINITVCMGLMDASHKTKQKRLKALWEIHLQCLPLEEVLDMCSLVFIRRKHGIKTKSDVGLMTSSPFWTLVKSQPCYPMLTSIEYERKKKNFWLLERGLRIAPMLRACSRDKQRSAAAAKCGKRLSAGIRMKWLD